MNSEFQKMLNFKGYGNPKNSIWFIGVEEALEYKKESVHQNYHEEFILSKKGDYLKEKEKFLKENPGRRYTSVYSIIGKIMSGILNLELDDYLQNLIFTGNGNCFLTNYYPLGKKDQKTPLPKKYFEWFQLESVKEYEESVRRNRSTELYNFWKKSKPKATIAFGVDNWDRIIESFKLEDIKYENFDTNLRCYPNQNFYLCPFFVNHLMSWKKINTLINKIKNS